MPLHSVGGKFLDAPSKQLQDQPGRLSHDLHLCLCCHVPTALFKCPSHCPDSASTPGLAGPSPYRRINGIGTGSAFGNVSKLECNPSIGPVATAVKETASIVGPSTCTPYSDLTRPGLQWLGMAEALQMLTRIDVVGSH